MMNPFKLLIVRPMIKIKSPICLSFKPPSALRQQTHITNMRPLACLDGDLKSGVSVADLILIMSLITIILCFIFCSPAFAGGIKERMKQRLPQIVALKNKGIIGETNTGYLGFVTAKKEKQDLVAAENKDRKAIYTHIAKKEQVSTQFVQERRAASLFSNAAKGHYYQNKAGVWVKK